MDKKEFDDAFCAGAMAAYHLTDVYKDSEETLLQFIGAVAFNKAKNEAWAEYLDKRINKCRIERGLVK